MPIFTADQRIEKLRPVSEGVYKRRSLSIAAVQGYCRPRRAQGDWQDRRGAQVSQRARGADKFKAAGRGPLWRPRARIV